MRGMVEKSVGGVSASEKSTRRDMRFHCERGMICIHVKEGRVDYKCSCLR